MTANRLAVKEPWGDLDVDLLVEASCVPSRDNFWIYRQYLDPKMQIGWYQREVAYHLQVFYRDLVDGKRPKLLLFTPPQHGKSRQVTEFLSWVHGKNPDLNSIFASYSDDLSLRTNAALQRMFMSGKYQYCFPATKISQSLRVTGHDRYARNSSLIEFVGKRGSFRNTTAKGAINGLSLDFGVIDDPIKGRAEAMSSQERSKVWSWLIDDFMARFSEHAGMLMILTRWHVDDAAGRFVTTFPDAKVLRYPALAERDAHNRHKGDPLFPELKSLEFLLERRGAMTQGSWESEYQGQPIVVGGGLFPIDKFRVLPTFNRQDVLRSVRYWDKAGTEDGGAHTAGVLMHEMQDHTFVVEDVVRGRWAALERERRILRTSQDDQHDDYNVKIWVEQEPGSGGKESAEATVRMLAGFPAMADKVVTNKEVRAEPYAAQVQGGNVALLRAEWNDDFLDEHEAFPTGRNKDQVDAAAGAFTKLTSGPRYDSTMSWVE